MVPFLSKDPAESHFKRLDVVRLGKQNEEMQGRPLLQ
jgi:hypothetical protein